VREGRGKGVRVLREGSEGGECGREGKEREKRMVDRRVAQRRRTYPYKRRGVGMAGRVAEEIDKVLVTGRTPRQKLFGWAHIISECRDLVIAAACRRVFL